MLGVRRTHTPDTVMVPCPLVPDQSDPQPWVGWKATTMRLPTTSQRCLAQRPMSVPPLANLLLPGGVNWGQSGEGARGACHQMTVFPSPPGGGTMCPVLSACFFGEMCE